VQEPRTTFARLEKRRLKKPLPDPIPLKIQSPISDLK